MDVNSNKNQELDSLPAAARHSPTGIPVWKRCLDIACILLVAPLVLPLMVVIAAVVKLVSPGPALFRQVRIGYRGQPFTCFKFRTMRVDAATDIHDGHVAKLQTSNEPMVKLDAKGDPRIIPCGNFLRALGLDEAPQIFNVLRGEMSLVGPRPCIPNEYKRYTPRHRMRLDAAPGLTGLWQVSGKNQTTFEQMIDLDIRYARTLSLSQDLRILLKTIPAIWSQAQQQRIRRKAARMSEQMSEQKASPKIAPNPAVKPPLQGTPVGQS